MNRKLGLYITYAIYLFVIFGILFAALQPLFVVAKEAKVIPIKTLESEVERLSTLYQVDKKLAMSILECESSFNPNAVNYNKAKDGTVWSTDLSYWQINDYFHEDIMSRQGLDINNPWDNLEYGFILLRDKGTQPWKASSKCWSPKLNS